jgi:hypothetical protein
LEWFRRGTVETCLSAAGRAPSNRTRARFDRGFARSANSKMFSFNFTISRKKLRQNEMFHQMRQVLVDYKVATNHKGANLVAGSSRIHVGCHSIRVFDNCGR